jgi:hypothetical protein
VDVDFLQLIAAGEFEEGVEVPCGTVDALVAVEAHEVETAIMRPAMIDGFQEGSVLVEAVVPDAPVDLLEGLPDHPASAHGEMAGFAAPLGALGDADGVARTLKHRPLVLLHVSVVVGGVGEADGVPPVLLRVAPSIPHHEDEPRHSPVIWSTVDLKI